MSTNAIIVCFSYAKNNQHTLNPKHVRADVRKVLTYTLNNLKIPISNTKFITDILPETYKIEELNMNFQDKIIKYLGNHNVRRNLNSYPLSWLENICREFNYNMREILNNTLPIIRSPSVIEFMYLFAEFNLVNGKEQYVNTITNAFNKLENDSKLFFYFTGHAYRTDNGTKISMVIPNRQSLSASYIESSIIMTLLDSIHESIDVCYILDCCYSEMFISTIYKLKFGKNGKLYNNISRTENLYLDKVKKFYIGSTLRNQTCGFYNDETEEGSVFTHFLFKYLQEPKSEFIIDLYKTVEVPVEKYRIENGKGLQHMIIGIGSKEVLTFPKWMLINQKIN